MSSFRMLIAPFAVIFVVSSVGCSSPTPGDTVEDFQRSIEAGEVERASQMIAGEILTIMPPAKLNGALAKESQKLNKKGGIASIEILSEDIQGNTASVRARRTFGDGSSDEATLELTRIDGAWKLTPAMTN